VDDFGSESMMSEQHAYIEAGYAVMYCPKVVAKTQRKRKNPFYFLCVSVR